MGSCGRRLEHIGGRRDHLGPEIEQVLEAVWRPLQVAEGPNGELGNQVDPLGVDVDGNKLAQLVRGIDARNKPAELVVVFDVLEPLARSQDELAPAKQVAQILWPFKVPQERSPDGRQLDETLQHFARECGRLEGVVAVKEELHGRAVLDDRPPRTGRLHRPRVIRGVLRVGPDKVKREARPQQDQRLLLQLCELGLCGAAASGG